MIAAFNHLHISSCRSPTKLFSPTCTSSHHPLARLELIHTILLTATWLGIKNLPQTNSRHISLPYKQVKLLYFCLQMISIFSLLPIRLQQFSSCLPKAWFWATLLARFNSPRKFLSAASPFNTGKGRQETCTFCSNSTAAHYSSCPLCPSLPFWLTDICSFCDVP